MNAAPVTLAVCATHRDHLRGTLTLTVGVTDRRGKVQQEDYEVVVGPSVVLLVKEGGEVHEVGQGGRCSCDDARFRRRAGGCKHALALRMAGLMGAQQGVVA